MNKVILMGRLVADPETRRTDTTVITRYRIAVDRRFNKEKQDADFVSIVAFGKGGEFAEKYLSKGKKIIVTGHIQSGSFKRTDGSTVYTFDVIAEDQEFAESRTADKPEPPKDEFMQIDNMEELPFA